ncbi:MAG TPA: methyltransferase [Candidatus Omnitrophica bacterium]|nr:methyltransferase [Candidatus Omnitrophota bacterium]
MYKRRTLMRNLLNSYTMTDYDKGWSKWLDCEVYGPTLRHQRRNIKKLLNGLEYNSILDIGCGSGDHLHEILKLNNVDKICMADISKEALSRAKNLIPKADCVQIDIEKGSIGNKFDLVLCCDVLEHISDDKAALRNIRKMAHKYLVVSTLSGKMRESEKHVGHVRNYALDGLLDKLSEAGFKPLKIIKWGFPFYSPLYRNLWDKVPQKVNDGKFGWFRKFCANTLYFIFMLNSTSKGDYLFILSESV